MRQLNILIYLNPNWKNEWGGELGLYEKQKNKLIQKKQVFPKFNRALIFNTNQNSWHGMPIPISCPKDQMRTAFNFYYLNADRTGKNNRFRAQFMPTDNQIIDNPDILKEAANRMDLKNPKYRN